MTDYAIDQERLDLVAIFYNAFQGMNEFYKPDSSYAVYFEQIQESYFLSSGSWVVGLSYPPEAMREELVLHMIVVEPEEDHAVRKFDTVYFSDRSLYELQEKRIGSVGDRASWKAVSRDRSRPLKQHEKVQDADFCEFLFKLQSNTVDMSLLKKIDLARLKDLEQNLKKLSDTQITPERIKELPDREINLDRFSRLQSLDRSGRP